MILLVGGCGFLGGHLCDLLGRHRDQALIVSRKPDPLLLGEFGPTVSAMSAREFAGGAGDDAIRSASAIVYLAWTSVPATFADEPSLELRENVLPAFDFFLRVAHIAPKTKIVLLSSGGTVYRCEGRSAPKSETAPLGPISAYGLGKVLSEEALRFVGRTHGTPYVILRVSNAIGRRQHNNAQGIVSIALRAARDGLPVELFGGGNQVRDFVDADDVAHAIRAACLETAHPDATWNIGSGKGLSIRDLLHRLEEVIGRSVAVKAAPPRKLDVAHIVLDCRKAAEELGWTAKIPIERSISDIWRSLQQPSKQAV
jgi:UDP-glucose 4-epimerase